MTTTAPEESGWQLRREAVSRQINGAAAGLFHTVGRGANPASSFYGVG